MLYLPKEKVPPTKTQNNRGSPLPKANDPPNAGRIPSGGATDGQLLLYLIFPTLLGQLITLAPESCF